MTDTGQPVPPVESPADIPGISLETPAIRPERPTAVTVSGFILLVFALLYLFSLVNNILQLVSPGQQPAGTTPAYLWSALSVSLVSVIFTALTGIALLRRARWARTGTIVILVLLFLFEGIVRGLMIYNYQGANSETALQFQRIFLLASDLVRNLLIYGGIIVALSKTPFARKPSLHT